MDHHYIVFDRFPEDEPLVVATDDGDSPQANGVKASPPIRRISRIGLKQVESRVEPSSAALLACVSFD